LQLFAEIELSFVLEKQRVQAEWNFVVPTHGYLL